MATVNTSVVRVLPVVEESGRLIWRCPKGIQDRTVELVHFPLGPRLGVIDSYVDIVLPGDQPFTRIRPKAILRWLV